MALDDVLQILVFAGAAVGVFALMCRLDGLRYRTHRASIVFMHAFMGTGCVLAGAHAVQGDVGVIDAAAVAATLCWVRASYANWRHGVPDTYRTQPTPLDETVATQPPSK